MDRFFSYVVEHDLGFAPNPFWRICTLANCKPVIRAHANVGDVIIGTGSKAVQGVGHLVYWMRVSEIMLFDEYWLDPRFSRKKPNMNGSKMHRYGDNIYWTGDNGVFQQIDSFHSEEDGSISFKNRKRDTDRTQKVLIGSEFAYYGKSAPLIPVPLRFVVKKGPGHKCRFTDDQRAALEDWLTALPARGYVGEPGQW